MDRYLIKRLKDEGFPCHTFPEGTKMTPTLSELIEKCGENFAILSAIKDHSGKIIKWHASGWDVDRCIDMECCPEAGVGATPFDAVAKLWLTINSKQP